MSKANDIAAALAARLATIRTANGYATEAGQHVYRGAIGIAEEQAPFISIVEQEDQVEDQRIKDRSAGADPIDADILLPFDIVAVGPCDPDNPSIAGHTLVADIKRAVFGGDLTWGGLATHTRYIGRSIPPRTAGSTLVEVRVSIRIGCVENLANP